MEPIERHEEEDDPQLAAQAGHQHAGDGVARGEHERDEVLVPGHPGQQDASCCV